MKRTKNGGGSTKSGNGGKTTTQVSFRIPTEWLGRADAIAEKRTERDDPTERTDALRLALSRGFRELEREYAIDATKGGR